MDIRGRYDIPLRGLTAGKHSYTFAADDSFFESYENPALSGGTVTAEVELTKSAGVMSLEFAITGSVKSPCDRCLDDCLLPVDYSGTLHVRIGQAQENDGETIWLGSGEDTLDVSQYIYESVVLSLPYRRIHPEREDGTPECNPDMLSRFRIVSQEEFDSLTEQEMQKMEDNPQWQKLREIKDKL